MVKWVIYKITSPSGRIYIGKTNNYKFRMSCYRNSIKTTSGRGSHGVIGRSILKYGFKEHKVEIIDTFIGTISECNSKEMFWIRTYMSNMVQWPDQNGMNLTKGGEGILGHIHSTETRLKIKNAATGRKATPETIIKLKNRPLRKNKNKRSIEAIEKSAAGRRGKRFTIDQLKRLSDAHIGLVSGNRKPVFRYSKNGVFLEEYKYIKEASDKLGISRTAISNNLIGKSKAAGGFIFKYKKEVPIDC